MRKLIYLFLALTLFACNSEDIDDVKPEIDLTIANAFPTSCDTLYFGEVFTVRMKFSDNKALSAYSLTIHDNFNQHSHDFEMVTCVLDPKKDGVNPLNDVWTYEIPKGLSEYITDLDFQIPEADNSGEYDSGDYHLLIQLVDEQGWSTQKGLSVKILHR